MAAPARAALPSANHAIRWRVVDCRFSSTQASDTVFVADSARAILLRQCANKRALPKKPGTRKLRVANATSRHTVTISKGAPESRPMPRVTSTSPATTAA